MTAPRTLSKLDSRGRTVHVVHVPNFAAAVDLRFGSPFVLFVAADASAATPNTIGVLADNLVKQGAVYVVCWGPGCTVVEEVFDWAWIAYEQFCYFPDETVLLTTSHPTHSLEEALRFALHSTTPTATFAAQCKNLIVLSVGHLVSVEVLVTTLESAQGGAA